ncbi:MAG: hypothetical protein PHQ52_07925, partial [Candidatus Omnitrophica bacterium]|nr:hypothetical protein [Candidatus Omnitrophota bacterium]
PVRKLPKLKAKNLPSNPSLSANKKGPLNKFSGPLSYMAEREGYNALKRNLLDLEYLRKDLLVTC